VRETHLSHGPANQQKKPGVSCDAGLQNASFFRPSVTSAVDEIGGPSFDGRPATSTGTGGNSVGSNSLGSHEKRNNTAFPRSTTSLFRRADLVKKNFRGENRPRAA
jgi:hypothetical protein